MVCSPLQAQLKDPTHSSSDGAAETQYHCQLIQTTRAHLRAVIHMRPLTFVSFPDKASHGEAALPPAVVLLSRRLAGQHFVKEL